MRTSLTDPFRKMSLKQQLILLFFILVSPLIVLFGYADTKAEQILTGQVTHAYAELNKQNHLLIHRDMDTVNRITRAIVRDPVTQDLNTNEPKTYRERLDQYYAMEKLLLSYSSGVNGGEAIHYFMYVSDPKGEYSFAPNVPGIKYTGVYFYNDEGKTEWIAEAERKKGSGFLQTVDHLWPEAGGEGILCYVRAVNNIYKNNDMIGVLVATMDRKIGESLQNIGLPNGDIFLTDHTNRVLASTGPGSRVPLELPQDLSEEDDMEGNAYGIAGGQMYIVSYDYNADEKLIYRIPMKVLLQQQNGLKRVIQGISFVYAVFTVIVMIYFWRRLIIPLHKLAGFVRSYEPGMIVPYVPDKRRDEVGVLIHSVYASARRLNELIHDRYVMELKHKETQLQLLYQQINPHMLYNTLESIYWKSILEGRSESAEMIKELSKLMKIGLSRGRAIIPLKEEIEHAKAYTRLQQQRLEEAAFKVEWHIVDDVLDCLIPKITLQPLIENAVLHGIRNMGMDGEIWVSARREDSRVVIRIEDNGYKDVDFEAIAGLLDEGRTAEPAGYGIRNVHQRIRLYFGPDYGLSYSRREGGGTIATVMLPAASEEEHT